MGSLRMIILELSFWVGVAGITATYILTAMNGLVGWYDPSGRLAAKSIADAYADLSVRAVQPPQGARP